MTRKSGRIRRIVLPLAVLGTAAYFGLLGGEYNVFEYRGIARQHRQEAKELGTARKDNAELQARVRQLETDPVTLERAARERFGLIREGERLYRFAPDSAAADTLPPAPEGTAKPADTPRKVPSKVPPNR